ncbi:DUF262 domain-containing protein [Candidatus Saccharibacteria bacterium]|nr:DUF262 domain-containing protein [Candidatus Saccharibacteria bacterium]
MPEIQRPFVWDSIKVRDLIDSIFRGFPIGYIITSVDPTLIQKDGTKADGKTSIIDGQQRITALRASILGEEVINKYYKPVRIKIAYNPFADTDAGENSFETLTPAIEKSSKWITDISKVLSGSRSEVNSIIEQFAQNNPDRSKEEIDDRIEKLESLKDQEIGYIKLLSNQLSIDEVADIFERINSKGVPLNQADFAMSKLASDKEHGSSVRKLIDYFAHLAKEPEYFKHIEANDTDFKESGLLSKIAWLKDDRGDVYDPNFSDIIRTSFTYSFGRGKLADLVSLLSGRNFEARIYEAQIAQDTIKQFNSAVLDFVDKSSYTDFLQIIESTGFIDSKMIGSKNALNYAYVVYLLMKRDNANPSILKKTVARWFVMSVLTSRYSSSPESAIDRDVKEIARSGVDEYLRKIEDSDISQQFWDTALVNDFDKASQQHPYLNTFFAAQVYFGDTGFLSDVTLRSIRSIKGDIHHTFPYDYLKKNGKPDRYDYNQIANFVYMEKSTNIQISNKKPSEYMATVIEQAKSGELHPRHPIGNITNFEMLTTNLEQNCIPDGFENMSVDDFEDYLLARRKLMTKKIEKYYKSL